jgi:hypothetical protein
MRDEVEARRLLRLMPEAALRVLEALRAGALRLRTERFVEDLLGIDLPS